ATPFGKIFSTNITPDVQTGIGSWTEVDLRGALREGVRPGGVHLYPAFPYTQRWLMRLWNAMFLNQGAYRPNSAKSAEWNRGAYLVEALAHCSACHSPRNVMGAERADQWMTGGALIDEVP